jgi:cobalt/nickel transport system permease protein
MTNNIPSYLLDNEHENNVKSRMSRKHLSFLDKTLLGTARSMKIMLVQAENATKDNTVHNINPYVKLFSLIYLVIVISLVNNPLSQIIISGFIFLVYVFAGLKVFSVYRKIFLLSFVFGFVVIFPAALNVITPGKIALLLFTLKGPVHFWIYDIPAEIGFTYAGFNVVALIFLRVLNSVSISLLVVFTTPFPSLIKSLKMIGVPNTFLMIISLAYKYIFILSRTIEDTYFALKSRLSGNIRNKNIRKVISGRIFFIFKRSVIFYDKTYYAMVSRGYTGKIKLYSNFSFNYSDFIALAIVVASGIIFIIYR